MLECEDTGLEPSPKKDNVARERTKQVLKKDKIGKKRKRVQQRQGLKYLGDETDLPYFFFLFLLLKGVGWGVNGEIMHTQRDSEERIRTTTPLQ